MSNLPAVERFVSNSGAKIYRIPCEAFPDFIVYAHLVLDAGPPTLVDTGSGYGDSNRHLIQGLDAVRADFGEAVRVTDIHRILITHGHIDHFGGLSHLLEQVDADVGIHSLDLRVLNHYEERVVVATKSLRVYLDRAGVPGEMHGGLMDIYGFSKKHVRSVHVDLELEDYMQLDGLELIHTPGHCPGQVCIVAGDVLLTADHILPEISPHQSPESITAYTGLGHYLESLDKIAMLGGFDLGLGGHEGPIRDLYARIDALRASHDRKLEKVAAIISAADAPPTIHEITGAMYPDVEGFHVLLALEEVGAHVEHLYQRGRLAISNLDEVQREDNPALRFELA